ncbi:hypothetical protein KO527_15485 [Pseudoalteromonas sp. C2R02]|uniref:hypothetical protein n=1 Tax=Pseudoalteromonas sp. C2R02 TaxID=2841565 RepID=UPI001C0A5F26|nr:hypothetical protein [Pseudoalteromonas sp. C2R02]MBU2970754.1 hypothetical protein [Pseudoalteromonas sp. C2R02]
MLTLTSHKGLKEIKILGAIILLFGAFFGLLSFWQNGPLSVSYYVFMCCVVYFFFATKANVQIEKGKIIKQRGWLFPSFKSQYTHLKSVNLHTQYIHQEGSQVKSNYAFYIGIEDGPFKSFIDLSWCVKDTNNGQSYIDLTQQLIDITELPFSISDEFKIQFKNNFGFSFELNQAENKVTQG